MVGGNFVARGAIMEGSTQTGGSVRGGPIGLSPVGTPKIAPNGRSAGVPAKPAPIPVPSPPPNPAKTVTSAAEGNASNSPAPVSQSGATAPSNSRIKMSWMKRAMALSLMYRHGIRIDKGSDPVSSGKGPFTKRSARRMPHTKQAYVPGTKEGQLLIKLASMAGAEGVTTLVKKGDSAKTAARKIAAVIKLKRAFKRIGF